MNSYKFTGLSDETSYTLKIEVTDKAGNTVTQTIISNTKALPTVQNTLKAGDYVKYPSTSFGGNIECIVLYDNTSTYGVQIISKSNIGNVTLGSSTFSTGINLWNNVISTLNSNAMKYINTTISSDARCVGSVPNNKNAEAG